ncbi:trehalose-phosphatase, partial [Dietzia sp. SLG510A3-3B2-2]|nr:trehalose-phosphatase [Dietzia sp. SLG510A3-3B2-2]
MTTAETLDEALRRAADAPTLVVACDYDGTLAPFVDDPTKAVPAPGAADALA